MDQQAAVDRESLEKRPGIFVVGSANVGKRTLLSRLLSVDLEDGPESLSDISAHGWTINTKYYTADVSLWMAHLHDGFSIETLPMFERSAALVMVFDTSDLSSFVALKSWVLRTDIQKFDILLCVGNKVDLLPGHSAHVEYRRRIQKLGESWGTPYTEFSDFGISESEGSSLLGDEEASSEIKRSCLEWCIEHNIEYVEACASNSDFDKCLSLDGDSQGVERIFGAISAHMWPGMILKSGDKITIPRLPEEQDLSEEESDYEVEYEILSAGSAEPWDDTEWVSANGPTPNNSEKPSTSASEQQEIEKEVPKELEPNNDIKPDEEGTITTMTTSAYEFEDLEQLMSEIGNVRDGLRLMPDYQRREMAAKLAMKMATMFGGGSSGDEDGFD